MGYECTPKTILDFHHLILSREECILRKIPAQGYVEWNGMPLTETAHATLHVIQHFDEMRYESIAFTLIQQKEYVRIHGYMDRKRIMKIQQSIEDFEKTNKGISYCKKPLLQTTRPDKRVRL